MTFNWTDPHGTEWAVALLPGLARAGRPSTGEGGWTVVFEREGERYRTWTVADVDPEDHERLVGILQAARGNPE